MAQGVKGGVGYADLVGTTLNKWFIKAIVPSSWGRTKLLCVCACGRKREHYGVHLRRGKTHSCGCYQRQVESLPAGVAARRDLMHRYQGGAKKRSLPWELTQEWFFNEIQQRCSYCGIVPSKQFFYKGEFSFVYNGVDRIDSTLGYTTTNSHACCEICNKAKRDLAIEEFTAWLDRIVLFRSSPRQ